MPISLQNSNLKNVTRDEGQKSAKQVSRIIWMAPKCPRFLESSPI